jgi:hypothetical protein
MSGDAAIRKDAGWVYGIIGGMAQELTSRVTRAAKGQAGICVRKFGRDTVALAYMVSRVVENHS